MTANKARDLKIVQTEIEQVDSLLAEAAKQAAPMVQRLATHRDRIDLAVKELESERFELVSRRDLVRRQVEAMEQGFALQIEDIEATMALYEGGLNSMGVGRSSGNSGDA